jgi:hypothetical protein
MSVSTQRQTTLRSQVKIAGNGRTSQSERGQHPYYWGSIISVMLFAAVLLAEFATKKLFVSGFALLALVVCAVTFFFIERRTPRPS